MTELRDRLQASLGESYRLERELGGGGMSRVFVAARDARSVARSSSRCSRPTSRRRQQRAVPPRDPARGAAAASAHRARARRRRDRRAAVLHDAVRRAASRCAPARGARPLPVVDAVARAARRRARARLRARARRRPPRHQARQRAHRRRLRRGHRLRHREGAVIVAHVSAADDTLTRVGNVARHAGVHGARAGGRRPERRPSHRHLLVRCHGVRAAHGRSRRSTGGRRTRCSSAHLTEPPAPLETRGAATCRPRSPRS